MTRNPQPDSEAARDGGAERAEETRILRAFTPARMAPDSGRVRLHSLLLIRWIAILGQGMAVLFVHFGLSYELPLIPALSLVALSVLVNLHAMATRPGGAWLGDRGAAIYLAYDLVQLALLLALTGGLSNPFALLILAPVTVSASVLSRASTLALALLAVAALSALGLWHLPLPWLEGGIRLPVTYILGIWTALMLAVIFITAYVFSLAAEEQRMSEALSATQLALAREQQLSAVGGLAAAAAHELGTPLGTIAVVAKELARELPPDNPLREDAELLLAESARCREILARLAARPEGDDGAVYNRLPIAGLIEAAAKAYQREGVQFDIRLQPEAPEALRGAASGGVEIAAMGEGDDRGQPVVARRPELLQGLGLLLQNALAFARQRVEVLVRWDAESLEVRIRDDGPGFAAEVLPYLGEPYVPSQRREGENNLGQNNLGLGVFIARTLLARTGAELAFGNRRSGGAEVALRWPRGALAQLTERYGGRFEEERP